MFSRIAACLLLSSSFVKLCPFADARSFSVQSFCLLSTSIMSNDNTITGPNTTSKPSLSATQRAWIVERRGPPEKALRLHEDWPVPKPLAGEVLVKVEAAALNPV